MARLARRFKSSAQRKRVAMGDNTFSNFRNREGVLVDILDPEIVSMTLLQVKKNIVKMDNIGAQDVLYDWADKLGLAIGTAYGQHYRVGLVYALELMLDATS
jgi:hypothetical protein